MAAVPPPAPVELLSFNGEKIYNAIQLNWETATESNNSYFTLERAQDGISYCNAEKVTGVGNSNTEKSYSFTDHEASDGINYYRLKQTDWNRDDKYCSETIALEYRKAPLSFEAYVYPNPLKDSKLRLYIGSSEAEMLFIITDAQKKNIYMKTFLLSGNGQTIEFSDVSGKLSSGLYMVTCISGKENLQQKLLVR